MAVFVNLSNAHSMPASVLRPFSLYTMQYGGFRKMRGGGAGDWRWVRGGGGEGNRS